MNSKPLNDLFIFACTFEIVRDGISVLDLDFNVLKVNAVFQKLHPGIQLVGKKCYEAFHQNATPCEVCPARETMTTGKIAYKLHKKCLNGNCYWVDIYTFPLINPTTNEIIGVIEFIRDVTQQNETEKALQASEAKYRTLVENIPAVIYKASLHDYQMTAFVSPQIKAFLGFAPEDFEAEPNLWERQLHPRHRERVLAELRRCRESGEPFDSEYCMLAKDGHLVWVQDRTWLVKDMHGQPLFLQGFLQDITERQKARDAFVQEQKKFQALVDSAPLGISIISRNGQYKYVNPKFVEMFGYTLEDIPTGRAWFARAYPNLTYRRQAISDWKTYLHESLLGETRSRTLTVTCKDGATKVINFRATPLEGGDHFVLYEDITASRRAQEALRESELRFRLLLECAGDAFFLHNEGRILEVNQQACDSLGYSREELLGMSLMDIEIGLTPEQMKTAWQQSFYCPITISGIHKRKDGSTFPVEIRASSFDYQGRRLKLALARDITQRLQTEEALRRSELRYRTLVEQMPAITYIAPLDGADTTSYVSPQVESILGFSAADFATEPDIWIKHLHPEDRDRVLAEIARCHSTGEPFISEYRMVAKDGRTVWVRDEARRICDTAGHPLFLHGLVLDITERKQAEQTLQQSEAKYRTLVDQIPAVTYTAALGEAASTYVSPQIEPLLGLSPAKYQADPNSWVKHLHPDDRARVLAELEKCLLTEEPFASEYRMVAKDGRTVWVRDEARLVSDQPERLFLQGVMLDITDRKKAEQDLRAAKEEWEKTFDAIPDLIMILDNQHRIVRANQAMAQKIGCSPTEAIGLKCYQAVHGLEAPPAFCPHCQVLADAQGHTAEVYEENLNGHFLVRVTPLRDPAGQMIGSVHVATDITEQKRTEEALRQSEERYRLIAENVSDVIWATDMDLRLSYLSPSSQRLLGFTPEEIRGRAIGEILPPASLGRALEVLSEEMAKEREGSADPARSRMIEVEQLHKDGSVVWTEVKAGFLRDATHQPIGILGVSRDITKRKQAEEALHRREAILQAVSFAAEKFLRNPAWENHIQEILGRLGMALEASRVYIFENHQGKDGALLASQRHEWVAPNITPQADNPNLQGFPYEAAGFARWPKLLSLNQMIFGNVDEFPVAERRFLEEQDIKSILVMPIFVNRKWWGFIGFDECRRTRSWLSSEVDALMTAAGILGAAISHSQSEKALRESEEKLRSLSNQLLHAQENERGRLATELHNVLGHDLLLLKLGLESLLQELPSEQASLKKEVWKLIRSIQDSIRNVRRLYKDLSPGDLEDLGLTASLYLLLENFARSMKLTWRADLDDLDNIFDMSTQTAIYRMVQEVLTNIGKHARAQNVAFQAKRAGAQVSFVIEDDGTGFDVAERPKQTLGLLAMEERVQILGGNFEIASQKNQGTKIAFTIPCSKGGN